MDIRKNIASAVESDVAIVYVAIELSMKSWLVAMQSPLCAGPSEHKLAAADAAGLSRLIERERARLKKRGQKAVRVVSCYEAGRDAFWLHRQLLAQGVESEVVDPGSVLVNRRARRAKSDRLDVRALLRLLIRHVNGDRELCRMVVVPTIAEEDERRPQRERRRLIGERVAHANRIQGLLATQGVYGYRPLRADRWARLSALRCADGQPLPAQLRTELERELQRLELAAAQTAALEAARAAALKQAGPGNIAAARTQALLRLRGIGLEFASQLISEVLYRHFASRRHVASFVGLTGSPFKSGGIDREQGLSKSGNRRARATLIEMAWLWIRHQPESALTLWFKARLAENHNRRKTRTLIVALARKLLVALWRYVTAGLVPQGALLKS